MRILLETKKYSIYYTETPMRVVSSNYGQLALFGVLVNNITEEIEENYEEWDKNYLTTIENLGKKLYKKAKRIK